MSVADELQKMGACEDMRNWAGDRTLEEIWRDCERGDWLIWLAEKCGVQRRKWILAACACARLALSAVPSGDERPRIAIEIMERWCHGEATMGEVSEAASKACWAYVEALWTKFETEYVANGAARSVACAVELSEKAPTEFWAYRACVERVIESVTSASAVVGDAAGHKAMADVVRAVITFEMVEEAWCGELRG